MANEIAVRSNFCGGLVENNPLNASDTSLTSASLAALAVVDATSHATVILDPDGVAGPPEIIWVTVHTAGATTATIQRAQESTSARNHNIDTPWIHAPTAADYTNNASNDRVFLRGSAATALDDEFNTGSLNAAWVRVDTPSSAHLTWNVAIDAITAVHTGTDSAAAYHALLKPISGGSFGIGNQVDVSLSYLGQNVASPMAGIIFADGVTSGSGIQIEGAYWNGTSTTTNHGIRRSTGFNTDANNAGNLSCPVRQRIHLRLKWVAANSFQQWISNDGNQWLTSVAAQAYTCTPTHIGLFLTSWTATTDFHYTFDYFRVS